ncbi:hypothetical protein RQM59_05010 [Flavobacteriaceae bacterium S356]|uniref:Uncharacterized protein n=1 Tax=Asprobacillus argus TaxID=3076534 RepID=A0ABU3LDE5_9FLAO|nr:hypothetical protein [Flavobacteriaceae bacterium S356]
MNTILLDIVMHWEIIKENKREYADTSYYLKAERNCSEGKLVLEVCWAQIMYVISVEIFSKNTSHTRFFKKTNRQLLYGVFVFYNDRIEKYGHQIMRITNDSPISKLERMNSMQKDGVLNHVISEKCDMSFTTDLPEEKTASLNNCKNQLTIAQNSKVSK